MNLELILNIHLYIHTYIVADEKNHVSWNDHVKSLIVSAGSDITAVPFEDEQQTTGTYMHMFLHICICM